MARDLVDSRRAGTRRHSTGTVPVEIRNRERTTAAVSDAITLPVLFHAKDGQVIVVELGGGQVHRGAEDGAEVPVVMDRAAPGPEPVQEFRAVLAPDH